MEANDAGLMRSGTLRVEAMARGRRNWKTAWGPRGGVQHTYVHRYICVIATPYLIKFVILVLGTYTLYSVLRTYRQMS